MECNLKSVFIVWNEFNRRPNELREILHCDLFFIKRIINNRNKFWKYFFGIDYLYKSVRTIFYLIIKNPKIVYAQSPPSFCPMVCFMYTLVFKKVLIVDGHNNAFESPWMSVPFYKNVLEASKIVLVHNHELAQNLKQKYTNIEFYTLPDRIFNPKMHDSSVEDSLGKYFLIVASFDSDEPLEELLTGVKIFLEQSNDKIDFIITGNYNRKIEIYEGFKNIKRIKFLNYINDSTYNNYLNNAFGIIALTTRPMVQQCAAIEALSSKIPLITTNNATNRRIFFKGAILTYNNRNDIKNAIIRYIANFYSLKKEMEELNIYQKEEWEKNFSTFLSLLPNNDNANV
jgi:glycosyl transferase family 1